MIQVYDQTWQLCLRISGHTSRQEYVKPFCVIKSLHDFLLSIPKDELIYDVGCGDNNLKLFYSTFHNKNIIGIDKTPEPDIYNHVPINAVYSQRIQWDQLNSVNYITAINSMHFDNIEKNLDIIMEKLKPGGKFYFTANDFNQLDRWRHKENWSDIGNVKYFWCGLDYLKEQKNKLTEYIKNDEYISLMKTSEHEEIINNIYDQAIKYDQYFGVLRVIIEKKNV
jgi:SAM-dependent methyltransferase